MVQKSDGSGAMCAPCESTKRSLLIVVPVGGCQGRGFRRQAVATGGRRHDSTHPFDEPVVAGLPPVGSTRFAASATEKAVT